MSPELPGDLLTPGWCCSGSGEGSRRERTLLCLVKAVEESEQLPSQIPLQATSDLAPGFAFGCPPRYVVTGGLVVAAAREDDDVKRCIELAIATSVETMTDGPRKGNFLGAEASQSLLPRFEIRIDD